MPYQVHLFLLVNKAAANFQPHTYPGLLFGLYPHLALKGAARTNAPEVVLHNRMLQRIVPFARYLLQVLVPRSWKQIVSAFLQLTAVYNEFTVSCCSKRCQVLAIKLWIRVWWEKSDHKPQSHDALLQSLHLLPSTELVSSHQLWQPWAYTI